jgi:hypothetical protein
MEVGSDVGTLVGTLVEGAHRGWQVLGHANNATPWAAWHRAWVFFRPTQSQSATGLLLRRKSGSSTQTTDVGTLDGKLDGDVLIQSGWPQVTGHSQKPLLLNLRHLFSVCFNAIHAQPFNFAPATRKSGLSTHTTDVGTLDGLSERLTLGDELGSKESTRSIPSSPNEGAADGVTDEATDGSTEGREEGSDEGTTLGTLDKLGLRVGDELIQAGWPQVTGHSQKPLLLNLRHLFSVCFNAIHAQPFNFAPATRKSGLSTHTTDVGTLDGLSEGLTLTLGSEEGSKEGAFERDGVEDGPNEGIMLLEGILDGLVDGTVLPLGSEEGPKEGKLESDGVEDGSSEGATLLEGILDGLVDGTVLPLGSEEGPKEGKLERDGVEDGSSEGTTLLEGILDGLVDGTVLVSVLSTSVLSLGFDEGTKEGALEPPHCSWLWHHGPLFRSGSSV